MSFLQSLLAPSPSLDPGTTQWLFDTSEWILTEFGTEPFYDATDLILPTNDFFPQTDPGSEEQLAQSLFDAVRQYAGMENGRANFKLRTPTL